jgi:hypothetical protein
MFLNALQISTFHFVSGEMKGCEENGLECIFNSTTSFHYLSVILINNNLKN